MDLTPVILHTESHSHPYPIMGSSVKNVLKCVNVQNHHASFRKILIWMVGVKS